MSADVTKVQMGSKTSSLKILIQGSGSFVVPSTATSTNVVATIPHNFEDDNLIWQVGFSIDFGLGAVVNNFTPYGTGDGRIQVTSTVDNINLYVTGYSSTAALPTDPFTISYYYRVLVP